MTEASSADTLEIMLKDMDADVWIAYDGREVLDLPDAWHTEVMLLNIGIPGMNGFGVARELSTRVGWPIATCS